MKIAFQMDPIETIDMKADTSFILGLQAAIRGYECWHYPVQSLHWRDGSVMARACPLQCIDDPVRWYKKGEESLVDLGMFDVVLMRQDPPFDMGYITATHLLETVSYKTLIVNDPAGVRNAPEKLLVTHFPELMPPTLISRDLDAIRAFRRDHGAIIIKPLFGNGGQGVFYLASDDPNFDPLLEWFQASSVEPVMVQRFLPGVTKGDVRVILIDGKAVGAINRIPQPGQIRSNMHVGGQAKAVDLDASCHAICESIGPKLRQDGLLLTGIDVIDGYLTEINVTSPTGIQEINRFNGVRLDALFWDAVERKLA